MALADIIQKIESDAREESDRILEGARERAARISADAELRANEYQEQALAEAEVRACREADRIVVSARLEARDRALTSRRELMEEALTATAEKLAAAVDADYATFLAERVASVARGGESLRMGSADTNRSEAMLEALRRIKPGLELHLAAEPAPFERGVLVEGERVRADLSLAAIVNEERDDLELVIASALFSEGA